MERRGDAHPRGLRGLPCSCRLAAFDRSGRRDLCPGRGLFAINPGGSIRWHFDSNTSGYRTTPILGADGNVYLASGVAVTALDAQGRLLWDYHPGGHALSDVHVLASPAIGVDGTIIATSFSETDGGTIHGIVETESTNGGYAGSPWPTERGNRANSGRAGG